MASPVGQDTLWVTCRRKKCNEPIEDKRDRKDAATRMQELSPSRFWRALNRNWTQLLTASRDLWRCVCFLVSYAGCWVCFLSKSSCILCMNGCEIRYRLIPLTAHNLLAVRSVLMITIKSDVDWRDTAPDSSSVLCLVRNWCCTVLQSYQGLRYGLRYWLRFGYGYFVPMGWNESR